MQRPLANIDLAGGIWRIKWDPYEARYVLIAAMYNGFLVVDCNDIATPKVIAEYKEHESIGYGCSWSYPKVRICNHQHLSDSPQEVFVATCSFYDHILKLSKVDFNIIH